MSNIEKSNDPVNSNQVKKKFSVTKKIMTIVVITLILLLPTALISSLIRDRENIRNNALIEVYSKQGQNQDIAGPVLYVPIEAEKYIEETKTYYKEIIDYARFLPNQLNIKGNVDTEILYRGIYEFAVYTGEFSIDGIFENLNDDNLDYAYVNSMNNNTYYNKYNNSNTYDQKTTMAENSKPKNFDMYNKKLLWEQAIVQIGISDMVGLKEAVNLKWNDKEYSFSSGVKLKDITPSGLTTFVNFDLKVDDETGNYIYKNSQDNAKFSYNLKFKGSKELKFIPLGKETNVKLESDWSDPSFIGAFLPENRQVSESFKANWKILDLNRNYPQKWVGEINNSIINDSKFGVDFLIPVDTYKETTRSVKYAILFIGLTFIVFFIVEVMNKKRIHPIQYIFVGMSLVLFYLLLVSISEHINFGLAYIISSIAIMLTIGLYSLSVFGGKKFSIIIATQIGSLYALMYVLLVNQNYSLLLGSIMLFIILVLGMYFTRNINWYNVEEEV